MHSLLFYGEKVLVRFWEGHAVHSVKSNEGHFIKLSKASSFLLKLGGYISLLNWEGK